MGHVLGHKSSKGSVTISNYKNRIRLRWRHKGKRYSLSLAAYNKVNLITAKKVVLQIELDIANGEFDFALVRYGGKQIVSQESLLVERSIIENFVFWSTSYKQVNFETNVHYAAVLKMLKRWKEFEQEQVLVKLNGESLGNQTYNERLAILKKFFNWLVKIEVWASNPLEEVSRRKVKNSKNSSRKPFSIDEIAAILSAFKEDTFCMAGTKCMHSHYYPFLYFIFKTGVRNAEAVGLRVGSLDFTKNIIVIKESLARTVKGTHAEARVRKATKNGKIRILPLTDDLKEILLPLAAEKYTDDLVFQSYSGQSIDDRMFQRRVFSVVLKKLQIPHRVLYACRHTFGSRCIDEGLTPVMTAFLMGNNAETALRNYTHQISMPKDLPKI